MGKQDRDTLPIAFRLSLRIIERLRRMAYWEERRLPSIVEAALDQYIGRHERRKGKYRDIPKGERVKRGRPSKGE